MLNGWDKIIKITGSVGLVGLLITLLMKHFFEPNILELLGSEKVFYMIIALTCALFVALIVAIKRPAQQSPQPSSSTNNDNKRINVSYEKSTHNGDNNF